jgi:hypothetical protein
MLKHDELDYKTVTCGAMQHAIEYHKPKCPHGEVSNIPQNTLVVDSLDLLYLLAA